MSETNDQTSTAPMTAEMKARNYAELVYALADCQSGGLTQPYDREGLIALAVWLNDEVAPALAAGPQPEEGRDAD